MIELQRHIEILLLENDCVIVPDFGGFIAHQVSADYDDEEHLFLPPSRTLGFSAQLRMNDSLLVHSYMAAYDISYPEALRRIETEVAELKSELQNNGSYQLQDLGTITVNDEGNYVFMPSEAGILSPTYYGLSSLSIRKLHDNSDSQSSIAEGFTQPATSVVENSMGAAVKEEGTAKLVEFGDENEDSPQAISIRLSWIRNALAAAAAVVALFLITTPIVNGDLGSLKMSHLNHQLLYKLIPQDTNMAKATPLPKPIMKPAAEITDVRDSIEDIHKETQTVSEATAPQADQQATPAGSYTIVLASQVKKSNAEVYVEKLNKMGFQDATIYIHDNVVRVVMGNYATPGEAHRRLNELNGIEGFEDAWVYKKSV